ncbi:Synembryn-A [Madurella mycetomatis]|uniref:Synembryn-A n=1 Tax=Madurella mycetomatis TaxID=100816 RepID=A0A175WI09_9PEZI|nr:Synembryn-A [Madurella mycetomatis]
MSQLLQSGSLSGAAKLDAVTKLVDKLAEDLESTALQPQQRDAALEELKVYGRDPSNADPIFTKKGVETLTKYALDSPSETTSRNALRVLCNAMLLKPEVRQTFVDLGREDKACRKLKTDSPDDEFLVSRVIFLTTYGTSINLPGLIEQHQLADSIIQNLSRHADSFSTGKATANPMDDMALSETLKLLFNVTRYCSDHISAFDPALINALMNLDLTTPPAQAALFTAPDPTSTVARLLQLLDLSMKAYRDTDLDQLVTPLVCVLSSLYEHAPTPASDGDGGADTATDTEKGEARPDVRTFVQSRLLPTSADRQRVLGQADTLPSRLLRNWTNPLAPEFRRAVAHFYFDMSGRDAVRFIENVGYGFASGFLFQNKIPVPEEAMGASGSEREGSGGATRKPVNPITGQFLSEEKFPDLPEMTTEEKEREAERLLKQTGVVSVQNPVEKAVQEGRFEELPDDSDEDDLVKDLD